MTASATASPLELEKLLPEVCFVRFEAAKLAKPTVLWSANDTSADDLASCCYSNTVTGEQNLSLESESTLFIGDRYGGAGNRGNAGGVRCGTKGALQVKGIGQNVLVGATTDHWHSYGGATLAEALRETIWASIFSHTLNGSVAVRGIILTGSTLPKRNGELGERTPRALIIREAPLRLGHFFGAPLSALPKSVASMLATDQQRTKAALERLHLSLISVTSSKSDSTLMFPDLLLELFRRFGRQLADAWVKKLIHGAVSESNITVDGRLLDFGMSSSVPDHAKYILARGMPNSANQGSILEGAAGDLIFYVNKYLGPVISLTADNLVTAYKEAYMNQVNSSAIQLLGHSKDAASSSDEAAKKMMQQILVEIMNAGNAEPYKILSPCPQYQAEMPKRLARYSLGEILTQSAIADTRKELFVRLSPLIPETKLRQKFVDCIFAYESSIRSEFSHDQQYLNFVRLNRLRLNAPFEEAYSPNLAKEIDDCCTDNQETVIFLESMLNYVTQRLSQVSYGNLNFKLARNGLEIGFDLSGKITSGGIPVPIKMLMSSEG